MTSIPTTALETKVPVPSQQSRTQGRYGIVPPLEKRLEAYERFQQLTRLGIPRRELVLVIAQQFGLNQVTVYEWLKGISPFGSRCGRITYREELFYVIGALLGDGCIYHWRNVFQIWLVGEREFCEKYAEAASKVCVHMRRSLRRPLHYKARHYSSKNAWFVMFQNAELFFLIRDIRAQLSVLREMLGNGDRRVNGLKLIEGFFDAEGCVKIIKEPVRKTPKVNIDFCNTNLELLQLIGSELMATLAIEPHFTAQQLTGNRKSSYHLRIYQKAAIAKFLSHVPTIKLKVEKVKYVEDWLRKR